MPAEVELKLGIAPGAAGGCCGIRRWPPPAPGAEPHPAVATYFDTPDGLLAEEGIGRLRHERGAWLQTVKGPRCRRRRRARRPRRARFPLAGPSPGRR
jgi:inorganic triphosphatase YgiF